ncbi:PDR/VanB family oxidoreductase [Streptomyces sp. NPDC057543]|uniref:PDR/VanB family oxidoreductase n=1 Tax=Streptomyces sp. NPDC057543 TaxID=3346163 RepID=UPI0036CC6B69
MTLQLERPEAPRPPAELPEPPAVESGPPGTLTLRVESCGPVAEDIVALTLRAPDGAELPPWEPGAHIDLLLPGAGPDGGELVRQYSLCGDPDDRTRWRVAVLRSADGRGGSVHVHDRLRPGDTLRVRGPRNHFRVSAAPEYLFIAGGIGITPVLAMVRAAERAGQRWRAVYLARERDRMAFVDELTACGPGQVRLHTDETDGRFDLGALLSGVAPGTAVYSCGPGPLLTALEELHAACEGRWDLHLERFAAVPVPDEVTAHDREFEVVLAGDGSSHRVPAGASVLSVLRTAGVRVDWSCESGTCGSCETRVLEGVPEHRDSVLDADERAAGDYMMICVSRTRCERLVLDL